MMRSPEAMMSTYRLTVREWVALQRVYDRLNEAEQQAMKIVQDGHWQYRAGMEALLALSEAEVNAIYLEEREYVQRERNPLPV